MAHGWYHRHPLLQSAATSAARSATAASMPRVRTRRKAWDVRVWPTWLLVGAGWLIARLPYRVLRTTARLLSRITYTLGRARRQITLVNLRLCFPELDDAQRTRLARQSFLHTTMGALEAMLVWLNPKRDVASRTSIHGLEHLEEARALGRGVLLLGGHFSTMDIVAPKLKAVDIDVMYRRNRNPAWEWLQVHGRNRYFQGVIERSDVRQTLRRLQQGRTIWYAPDQDYGRKRSVFAPFFGIPTASIRATARLARFNRSPVLLMTSFRDLDELTWSVHFHPPLTNYPTGNDEADAATVNAVIEDAIRTRPEQYLWMHRRFKTRPEGSPPFYRKRKTPK